LLTGQSQKVSTLKSLQPCTHSEVVEVTCLNAQTHSGRTPNRKCTAN